MMARLLAIPFLLVGLASALYSFVTIQQDLAFTKVETEVSFWGRGDYLPTPETRLKTERGIRALVSSSSWHPDYLVLRASQLAWEGYWDNDDGLNRQAITAQYQALENRPAHGQAWLKLVQYAPEGPGGDAVRQEASARLQALKRGL